MRRQIGWAFAAAVLACSLGPALGKTAQRPQTAGGFTSPVKPGEPDKKFPVKQIWVLREFNGKPVPADLTLSVDDNFRGAGSAGCNTWSATVYPSRGQRLGVGPIAITHNTCDAAKTQLENAYLTAIHSAPFWDMEGSELVLKGPGGVMRFKSSI